MPGGDIAFPWHQDLRPTPAFRDQVRNYVQTVIVVDEATVANGCLHIIPESHKLGDLKAGRGAERQIEEQVDLARACSKSRFGSGGFSLRGDGPGGCTQV